MFKLARGLLRHKIGVLAVIAFAFFVFSGNGSDEQAEASSPWAKNAPAPAVQTASADDDSFTAKLGEVANQAGEYAAENLLGDKDLNPVAMGDKAVSNFDDANSAFSKANSN